MLNSNLYKKYYPIKSGTDILVMDAKDRPTLLNWIIKFNRDIKAYNLASLANVAKKGVGSYRTIESTYCVNES